MRIFIVILFLSTAAFAKPLHSSLAFSCDAKTEDISMHLEISSTAEASALIRNGSATYDCPLHFDKFIDGRKSQVRSLAYSFSRIASCEPALPQELVKRLSDNFQVSHYPGIGERAFVSFVYRREHARCRLQPIRELNRQALMNRLHRQPPQLSSEAPAEPPPPRMKSKLPVGARSVQST